MFKKVEGPKLNWGSNGGHMAINSRLVFQRMDKADLLISRIHPELGESLRRFRIAMRFHAFIRLAMKRGETARELAQAAGLPEEVVVEMGAHAPENPLRTFSSHERQWLHGYYRSGELLRVESSGNL